MRETVLSINKELVDSLRRQLEQTAGAAVRALSELVEMGESESVRLAAAAKILDLVGVQPAREVQVNVSEVERVEEATRETLERLRRNVDGRVKAALPKGTPELETLFVLEGEDEELPVGGVRPGSEPIEAHVVD